MGALFWSFFNVSILVAVLVYFLRQPLTQFVSSRHVTIRDELQSVSKKLNLAKAQFEEFSSKLKAIDVELQALKEQAARDGSETKLKIVNEAKLNADRLMAEAKSAYSASFDDLRKTLRSEYAAKVLSKAEEILSGKLTRDDRVRIRREFSNEVEQVQ